MNRCKALSGTTLLALLAAAPLPLHTQSASVANPVEGYAPAVPFEHSHPDAGRLLRTFAGMQTAVYERLLSADTRPDRDLHEALYGMVHGSASRDASSSGASVAGLGTHSPRLAAILDRAHDFQLELYGILAAAGPVEGRQAMERAVSRYLSDAPHALPAVPKSMDVMHGARSSTAFRRRHPASNGLLWASRWLQLAFYEPLLLAGSPGQRDAGIDTTVARYHAKLDQDGAGPPVEMPSPPAIAPELVRLYPDIAAILDNLNLLHEVVADLLADPGVVDRAAELERVADQFTDPHHLAASEYDWIVMALRHGIYNQGGPALGTLSRSERNRGLSHLDHSAHGGAIMMPGMGSGGPGIPSGGGPIGADDGGRPSGHEGHEGHEQGAGHDGH